MLLQNEDEFDFQLIFPHTNRFLCKNHTQNVSEFRSEKKLVCVWLLLLLRLYMRLCLCEFMRECGNSRRNSLFVVLLFAIFSFRRCRVVAWLRSNLNFLRFCFGCSTHKRAHIYIYTTQRRTCVLSVLFYREGKARRKKSMLCIHTQNRATHVFRYNRVAPPFNILLISMSAYGSEWQKSVLFSVHYCILWMYVEFEFFSAFNIYLC